MTRQQHQGNQRLARGNTETLVCHDCLGRPAAKQVQTTDSRGNQRMKKILVALLAAVTVGGAFAQSSFPDVPENHWAGGAVDRIADLGIVIGFPDGTFRGNEAFTRYQSALVVSRLLDVIGQELDARQALTDADLAALANALQDLAATVDAHDSAIASIGDDVAVNNARLDAIEALLASGDAAELQDLLNQLEALRLAADTAAAQAAAAHDLANNALGAANAAASRAAQNADAIAALSWFANDLETRVKALEDAPTGDASLAARVSAAENDIANIREFVILIRRDQVAMRGQIAALEGQVGTNTADIADLRERVGVLEENMITFDGSITVSYRLDRTSGGPDFDVDRAYGVGLGRSLPGGSSVFSTGVGTRNNTPVAGQRPAEHRRDVGTTFNEGLNASLNLNVSFGRIFDGAGSPSALNDFEAVVNLYLRRAYNLDGNAAGTTTFDGYVFAVREFTGTFSPIGDAPLTFSYGEEISVNFTSYVFNQVEVPGFVATLENPLAFLDFLDPTLTFAYVAPSLNEVYRGARLTVSPFEGVAIGASFAQHAVGSFDKDDTSTDNVETTVWGVDASAAISIFSLS
ncbi:MAG: S-layer homology domain-containing protein, partial [Phycisphaerales bacterium JB038]